MSPQKRPRGRPKVKVVLPDGSVVYGLQEAAHALGRRSGGMLIEQYGTRLEDGSGWRVRQPEDARTLTIELPNGERVQGWRAAAAALKRDRKTLRRYAERVSPQLWRILPVTPNKHKVRITLPDGRSVQGWQQAVRETGETEAWLRWRALPTRDGYRIRPIDGRSKRYGDKTQRPRRKA